MALAGAGILGGGSTGEEGAEQGEEGVIAAVGCVAVGCLTAIETSS